MARRLNTANDGSSGSLNLEAALVISLLVLVLSAAFFMLGGALEQKYREEEGRLSFYSSPPVARAVAGGTSVSWGEGAKGPYTVWVGDPASPGFDRNSVASYSQAGKFRQSPALLASLPEDAYIVVEASEDYPAGSGRFGPRYPDGGNMDAPAMPLPKTPSWWSRLAILGVVFASATWHAWRMDGTRRMKAIFWVVSLAVFGVIIAVAPWPIATLTIGMMWAAKKVESHSPRAAMLSSLLQGSAIALVVSGAIWPVARPLSEGATRTTLFGLAGVLLPVGTLVIGAALSAIGNSTSLDRPGLRDTVRWGFPAAVIGAYSVGLAVASLAVPAAVMPQLVAMSMGCSLASLLMLLLFVALRISRNSAPEDLGLTSSKRPPGDGTYWDEQHGLWLYEQRTGSRRDP